MARQIAEREEIRSIFAQPLLAKGHLLGVLAFTKPEPYRFALREREFIAAFADLIAVAVENAGLYDRLQDALHLRDQFLSVAAHELRTPVAALRGYVQLLLRPKALSPEGQRHSLEAIERQTKRITRLVEDLFETISPMAQGLERRMFDLSAATEEAAKEASQVSERHRIVVCRPGPILVEADSTVAQRVLTTLLDNAIRFSPEGGRIEVTVAIEEGMAQVSVRDFGLGIPQQRQSYVFEPFYEPYPAGTPGYMGVTGLGLYVAKIYIERLGGKIWFTSEEGMGSTFSLALPLLPLSST
ncbi:MAG: GAF domain-containing protein [Chloroflexi bacterium]|nr:GAF domain-containing protein [Chloroflexota bacterium]